MTKDEAYQAMLDGKTVSHRYFGDDEFIFINDDGMMITEEGYRFEEGWKIRTGDIWQNGWSIKA
jgi:hypothetical protein